jgi:hypothetical protein
VILVVRATVSDGGGGGVGLVMVKLLGREFS